MSQRRETWIFACVLALAVGAFLHESLFAGRVLSPGDVVYAQQLFAPQKTVDFEPANRLLMDPVLQFQPWIEFNKRELAAGRLPLWNPHSGCGAPHLANAQSGVFDPFHAIAYLTPLPQAHAWIAATRLWVAGLGMFVLARAWGLKAWGRWFAGMTFPFCGFLILWLLYPVTSAAVWLPWMLWAAERTIAGGRQDAEGSAGAASSRLGPLLLAASGACSLLAGHVQTSAHVFMFVGIYACWRGCALRAIRPTALVTLALCLAAFLAAVQVIPLGAYLMRSPVWGDRDADRPALLAVSRPRVLDAACTALPLVYGSQRAAHPNLAKALGVHNLNESAGGFAGLCTLVWLVPAAWQRRRDEQRITFLFAIAAIAAVVAFEVPPFVNLTRLIPVVNVTDNRRLVLWLAFALCVLGGYGIDAVAARAGTTRRGSTALVVAMLALLGIAAALAMSRPWFESKAIAHYAGDVARARRQADAVATVLAPYYAAAALLLVGILLARRAPHGNVAAASALALVLMDLFAFGRPQNPAIDPRDDRPQSPVIDFLRTNCAPPYRVVGVGAELLPNLAMRYGLADCRNYDSVELAANLDWFEPIYEPEPDRRARSSRRTVTWEGILRSRERLEAALVRYAVSATEPPRSLRANARKIGAVWVVELGQPTANFSQPTPLEIRIDASAIPGDGVTVPVTFDPGWHATVDGHPAHVSAFAGSWLRVEGVHGARSVRLTYDPIEVRIGIIVSLATAFAIGLLTLQDAMRQVVRKTGPGAWRPATGGDRIGVISTPFFDLSRRLSAEGCDTDGPLHV
jgi:hypothetical protein